MRKKHVGAILIASVILASTFLFSGHSASSGKKGVPERELSGEDLSSAV